MSFQYNFTKLSNLKAIRAMLVLITTFSLFLGIFNTQANAQVATLQNVDTLGSVTPTPGGGSCPLGSLYCITFAYDPEDIATLDFNTGDTFRIYYMPFTTNLQDTNGLIIGEYELIDFSMDFFFDDPSVATWDIYDQNGGTWDDVNNVWTAGPIFENTNNPNVANIDVDYIETQGAWLAIEITAVADFNVITDFFMNVDMDFQVTEVVSGYEGEVDDLFTDRCDGVYTPATNYCDSLANQFEILELELNATASGNPTPNPTPDPGSDDSSSDNNDISLLVRTGGRD
jgi:hypothetical protein